MSAEITLPVGQQNQNIVRLATAQALAGANSVVFYATGAIVGNAIAPSPTLATLPITIFVLGMAACILPFGALARRRGRKTVFMVGTGAGVLTGALAALAVAIASFGLFCLAAFFGGAYAAVARAGALAGHGRRRGGGDHRPDAGYRDHEFVAAAHLCDDLYRSGAGGGGIRAGLAGSKNPRAGGAGQIGRAPAGRNRAPAGVFPDGF